MYKVDTSVETFEFDVDGKEYSIPTMQNLPLKVFREIQSKVRGANDGMTEETAVYALLDTFETLAPGCTETLSFAQAVDLMKAYTTYKGGEPLGKS